MYPTIRFVDPSAPPPSEPDPEFDDDPPPPYYDPNFTQQSEDLSRRLNESSFFEVASCTNNFKQHYLLLTLFIIAVIAAITMGVLYIFNSQSNEIAPAIPLAGDFGSRCIMENDLKAMMTNQSMDSDESLKCHNSANLQCDETSLTCECVSGMYFDRQRSSCLSFAGQSCSTFRGYKPCTPHAFCFEESNTSPGVCHCEQDYVQASNGLCLLGHEKFGCTTRKDCNVFEFLYCIEGGQCNCDAKYSQEWDDVKKLCITFAGGPCFVQKQCVSNATCSNGTHGCVCDQNYKKTKSGLCALDYDQECVSGKDCHPSFICTSVNTKKYCRCRPQEIFRDGQCVARAGKRCLPNINVCDSNSMCDEVTGRCLCVPGYSQTKKDTCLAKHGVSCESNDNCNYEELLFCNEQTGMCDCKVGFSYREGVCVAISGAGRFYRDLNVLVGGLISFLLVFY